MHIELRDERSYSTKGIQTVTFKRDSSSHIHLKYFIYAHGLKKNFIFVDVLEDRGYDVVFSKEKSFLRHVATG